MNMTKEYQKLNKYTVRKIMNSNNQQIILTYHHKYLGNKSVDPL